MSILGSLYTRAIRDYRHFGLVALAVASTASLWGCAGAVRVSDGPSYVPAEPVSRSAAMRVQPSPDPPLPSRSAVAPATGIDAPGVTHRIERGQTLWRIARSYGVAVTELARANGIDDPTRIETGQEIRIPGATRQVAVVVHRPSKARSRNANWRWPVADGRVLSYFGAPRKSHRHAGVDIVGRPGQGVLATRPGTVVYSGDSMRGYGKTVIVDHGEGVQTLYAHNSKLLVRVGERVRSGQAIARIGKTGNASTEHCHFEVRRETTPIDPLRYLTPEVDAIR